MMRCSRCATNNPSTNNFCAKCGNALARRCARCAAENPPTADFCGKCGARLGIGDGTSAGDAGEPAGVSARAEETVRAPANRSSETAEADGDAGSPRVATKGDV